MDYSKYLNKIAYNIKPSGIRKFFDLASERKDIISLGVGEPDFDTPWVARDNAIKTIKKGYTQYTGNAGLPKLRELICKYYSQRAK
jgi:aminotransferase